MEGRQETVLLFVILNAPIKAEAMTSHAITSSLRTLNDSLALSGYIENAFSISFMFEMVSILCTEQSGITRNL